MIRHVIFVNGPPGSGKDLVGEILKRHSFRNELMQFKAAEPIKEAIAAFLDIQYNHLEAIKELPVREANPALDSDVTIRQLLIEFSEDFVKPRFGEDIFGKMLANKIRRVETMNVERYVKNLCIVTDAGFHDEVATCIRALRPHGYTFSLWQMHRPGHDFTGDSRSYLDEVEGVEAIMVGNNETIVELSKKVIKLYEEILT
jgi:hypothetical protein